MEINNGLGLLLMALMLCGGIFIGYALDDPKTEIVEIDKIVFQEKVQIVEILGDCNVSDEVSGNYALTKSEYEDEADELKALELASNEINSRDLKKAIYDALVLEGVDIEDYKDITKIKVVDEDVDDNEVTYDLKVYYMIDGDEDETESARLNEFTIEVDHLDFDDEYEDAEVNEDYLDTISVKKIYN